MTSFHSTYVLPDPHGRRVPRRRMTEQSMKNRVSGDITPVPLLSEADHITWEGSEPLWSTDLPSVRQTRWNKWYSRLPMVPWPLYFTVENQFPISMLSLNTHNIFQVEHTEVVPWQPKWATKWRRDSPFLVLLPFPPLPCRSHKPCCREGRLAQNLVMSWIPGLSHSALALNLCILLQTTHLLHFASMIPLKQHKTFRERKIKPCSCFQS